MGPASLVCRERGGSGTVGLCPGVPRRAGGFYDPGAGTCRSCRLFRSFDRVVACAQAVDGWTAGADVTERIRRLFLGGRGSGPDLCRRACGLSGHELGRSAARRVDSVAPGRALDQLAIETGEPAPRGLDPGAD